MGRDQLPALAPADGETIGSCDTAGSVGMTGAAVSVGSADIVGAAVTTGFAVLVAAAVGAAVGIEALPRTEQVQPTSRSISPSSGMKKNRFMIRISFRFFSDSVCTAARAIRLRRKKKYAILRV